jgi:WD40 repeat protein
MGWNKRMRDLLAVGYGPYDFAGAEAAGGAVATSGGAEGGAGKEGKKSNAGMIALWTMANPEQPQAILKTPGGVGVTSLDFSATMPNILAAGLYDGTICLWDVAMVFTGRSDGSPALVSNKLSPGAPSDAVWQIQWVRKEEDGMGGGGRATEVLVSISTDGKVTEWTIHKGLQAAPLMTLKRARAVPPAEAAPATGGAPGATTGGAEAASGAAGSKADSGDALGAAGSEGLLSRTAVGLTLDFHPEDPTVYFLGTEDGLLAKCSTSYAEQYLEVVSGHAGPINRVRLSPFLPSALLTASSDGACKLWNVGPGGHCFNKGLSLTYTPEGAAEAVADLAWSPSVSNRFASVSRDGHVRVWDAGVLSKAAVDVQVLIEEEDYRADMDAQVRDRGRHSQRLL